MRRKVRADSRHWKAKSETDTPQAEAHQRYRSREKDSKDSRHRFEKAAGKAKKKRVKKKGGESALVLLCAELLTQIAIALTRFDQAKQPTRRRQRPTQTVN
jgi:hypothetical protein